MYLSTVLADIKKESAPPKKLHAEHLFKLNEAVFNLPEEDAVDTGMALKLFQTVEKIRKAYNEEKFDNTDSNFFYDYLALLGTMQNQHFFSHKQTEKMLGWIQEVVSDGVFDNGPSSKGSGKELEAEVKTLRKKLEKYEGKPVEVKGGKDDKGGKGGAKGKTKAKPEPVKEAPTAKGKGKGKKGKMEIEEPPPAKGKVKGAAKGKGKGKMVEEEPPPLRQSGKAKGKGKGKGKDKDYDDEPPPLRAAKGKGKAGKAPEGKGAVGKGKGKDKDEGPSSKGKDKGMKGGKDAKGKGKGKWKPK